MSYYQSPQNDHEFVKMYERSGLMPARFQSRHKLYGLAVVTLSAVVLTVFSEKNDAACKPHAEKAGFVSTQRSFREIGMLLGTDKVVANRFDNHGYDRVYPRYMERFRDKPVKMLEIGLGCSGVLPGAMKRLTNYTAGRSVLLWKEYFSRVELWMAEKDHDCAEGLKQDQNRGYEILIGDQSDKVTLQRWVNQSGGSFDFIIDDGGHMTSMILPSFEVLFHTALRPGGTYFVEDLHFQKDATVQVSVNGKQDNYRISLALHKFSQWLLDNTASKAGKRGAKKTVPTGLMNVDCYHDMCAFSKYDCSALEANPTLLAPQDVKWCQR